MKRHVPPVCLVRASPGAAVRPLGSAVRVPALAVEALERAGPAPALGRALRVEELRVHLAAGLRVLQDAVVSVRCV